MEKISFSELLYLPEVLIQYELEDDRLVDFTLGNDEQIYILYEQKISPQKGEFSGSSNVHTRWCALNLMIDWQTGEVIRHCKLDFGQQKLSFHFIQPIGDLYLLVCARSRLQKDGQFQKNAVILDQYGARISSFCLGDGIQQCFVDGQNRIVTSYFDEGVFNDNPVGKSGLTRWSMYGELEWENPFCSVCDCYAMNLDAEDNLWFYYYSDFMLVKTDYEKHWAFKPGISGASSFLIGQNATSFLFQGGYRSNKYGRMELRGTSMTRAKECVLAASNGSKLNPVQVAFRKSIAIVLDHKGVMYGTDWIG